MRTLNRRLWIAIGAANVASVVLPPITTKAQRAQTPATQAGASPPGRGGETYLSDGGPSDTRVRFIRDLILIAGQFQIADELVAVGRWRDAHDHLLDQTAELRDRMQPYQQRHGQYSLSADLAFVTDAIEAQDVAAYKIARNGLDKRLADNRSLIGKFAKPYHRFALRAIVEGLRAASSAYETAADGGGLGNILEYRESRGYFNACRAEFATIVEQLKLQDEARTADISTVLAAMSVAWPSLSPPQPVVIAPTDMAVHVARIDELTAPFW